MLHCIHGLSAKLSLFDISRPTGAAATGITADGQTATTASWFLRQSGKTTRTGDRKSVGEATLGFDAVRKKAS